MLSPAQRIVLEVRGGLPFASYFSVTCGNAEGGFVAPWWSPCDYNTVPGGH